MKRFLKISAFTAMALAAILTLSKCKVDEGGIYGAFPYMNIPFSDTLVSKQQQTVYIPVETNRKFGATVTNATWVTAKVEGNNIVLKVEPNDQESSRSATIEVKTLNATVSATIILRQDASGEITFEGDLILSNAFDVENNTYTKTTQSLIVGDVISNTAASASAAISAAMTPKGASLNENITVTFDNKILEVAPSNILDKQSNMLSEQINSIGRKAAAYINTRVSTFPYKLVYNNELERFYFVACELRWLPSSDSLRKLNLTELHLGHNHLEDISSINGLENLRYLNLSNNQIREISPLTGNSNIEELVLDNNPISVIDPLAKLPNLRKLSLKGLPLQATQYEVFAENLPEGCITDTTGLRQDESPLAIISAPEEKVHDASSLTLTSKVELKGEGEITETGFYWGTSRKFSDMSCVTGIYNDADSTITATIQDANTNGQIYFFRAYAQNYAGISYSEIGRYGENVNDGDYFIFNENDFKAFYDQVVTRINGSLYIGNMVDHTGDGIISTTGESAIHFAHSTISSAEYLKNISYIDRGLYLVNTDVKNIENIAEIDHISTLHLEGNKIENIPNLSNIMGLKTLNVARNEISDLTPLFALSELDTLILGNTSYPYHESNDIGVLTGLETMSGLKYLDLSGLPLHSWQVNNLRYNMPDCEIVFTPGNRTPFLPEVTSEVADLTDGKVIIKGSLKSKGEGDIIEYGFYWGKDKNSLTRVTVGNDNIGNGTVFSHELSISDEDVYYYQPFAVNTYGESKSVDYREFTLSYINLSERGTSNSYIVTNAGRYAFNANIIGNGSSGIIDTANFHTTNVEIYPASADLLWETSSGIISDISYSHESGEIHFLAKGAKGNALIAARDGNGTILWSWHIWITDEPVVHNYVNHDGKIFQVLDRNLGAIRAERGSDSNWDQMAGMSYQWGRKDPFTWHLCEEVNGRKFTIQESIENPLMVTTTYDLYWMYEQNLELWNDRVKTIYDPCPVGYRIATKDVWTGFSKTGQDTYELQQMNVRGTFDNGHYFLYDGSNTAWYPIGTSYNGYFQDRGVIWTSFVDPHGRFNIFTYAAENVRFDDYTTAASETHNIRCMYDKGYVDITLPTITIDRISDVGYNSATAHAYMHSHGSSDATSMGFVWSTSHNPTLETDDYVELIPVLGEFSAPVSSLRGFTTYYIRAYASNENGTAYSDELSFTTDYDGTIQNLSISGTSNCYIVPPVADHYSIDASVIGNGTIGIISDSNFHTEDVNIDPASVKILWAQCYDDYNNTSPAEDMISFIELNEENNTIHFVPTEKEGNVLVAATDENDVILWSWHLWITDKPKEDLYINHEGKMYYVLDRNLGATRSDRGTNDQWREAVGLHYQWGRKDPFTNGYQTANIQLSMIRSIQNPTRMSTNWQWMETAIPQAWNDSTKTIYDPCPAGYKVIPLDAWSAFSTKGMDRWSGNVSYDYYNVRGNYNKGWNFVTNGDNTTYYPSTGNGYHDIYPYGDNGHYWSANGDGYNGYCLRFYYEDEFNNSLIMANEGSGYVKSVRCAIDEAYHNSALPSVATIEVEVIGSYSVTAIAEVTAEGIDSVTDRGFVWGKYDNPTLDNSSMSVYTEGSYIGAYSGVIEGLEAGTTYYIRAYATNSNGTSYGKSVKVRTKDGGGNEGIDKDDDFEW